MSKIVRLPNVDELNSYVANKLLMELSTNSRSAHFLPTGNTYLGIYGEFIPLLTKNNDRLDFSQLTIVNLDEYVEDGFALKSDDSRSFAFYMRSVMNALKDCDFNLQNHLFPSSGGDHRPFTPYQLLHNFDNWIKNVDVASAFLGLGPKQSPHIAFCSPGYTQNFNVPWQEIGAYISPVDEVTRNANTDNYGMNDRSVPSWSCTISPGTLLQTKPRNIYLVAYGQNKDISVINRDLDIGKNPASILKILADMGCNVEIITIS